ncbi:peroxiredoxin-like family protein [Aquimarina sediminis]|uniref:peroxiredoxin-like family protein n=1 Tax=Aquimarina sediminis TaxID=2070536 RepID=UPI000CA07017|nr:peroxiredoxin-like family protein [Aquimarina sediminis]
MDLIEELRAKKNASAQNIPTEKWNIMMNSTQQLIKEHLSKKALKEGDKMIDFTLPNAVGGIITLSEKLEKGSVIISFYRGGWCPYCNMELRALQEILPQIKKSGASLLAISPETPDHSLNTSEKNNLQFDVLSDVDNSISKKIGLVFKIPKNLREVYHSFNIDVPKHNGNSDYELPMPATFVINKNGMITYAFVPEDYTERADPKKILELI